MVQIIRMPKLVPAHLRRLVYASIILSCLTFAFSMVNFGIMSLWISPPVIALTWIYHLVLIIKHNTSLLSSTHKLLWETTHALFWGYCLAVLWTGAFLATIVLTALRYEESSHDILMSAQYACAVTEILFTLASTAVMWALMLMSTELKKTGGSRKYLHRRQEFVQRLEQQEESHAV
ncbi:hypothetical protein DL96DRAFT_1706695 [Flagelloscypha sp. PMI_526]|nr:hypothetical protein DL96DRAFT_1706695 [Flagelloscypha sp. PMI_526]